MIATCLTVLGIVGTYCTSGYHPAGYCTQQRLPDVVDCTIPAEHLLIRASWYDPALGGINCQHPCDSTADGTAVDDCYNWCIACPDGWQPQWQGETFVAGRWLDFGWVGRWQCRDRGGAVRPVHGRWFTQHGWQESWVITVDFMTQDQPPWAYWLLEWEGSL